MLTAATDQPLVPRGVVGYICRLCPFGGQTFDFLYFWGFSEKMGLKIFVDICLGSPLIWTVVVFLKGKCTE